MMLALVMEFKKQIPPLPHESISVIHPNTTNGSFGYGIRPLLEKKLPSPAHVQFGTYAPYNCM